MGPYTVASPIIHTLSLFSSDFQLSCPLACSSFPFPRSKETHFFGAKPIEEIVWFWNYPSALNKVGKPSFQNSKHHLRPKLSNFNLVLTQKWWQRPKRLTSSLWTIAPYSQKVTVNHSVIFQLRGPEWFTGAYTREFTSQEILTTNLQAVVSQSGRYATKRYSPFLA